MQDVRAHYQMARDRCLQRVECALIGVTVTAAILGVAALVTQVDRLDEEAVVLLYLWLGLPLIACIVIINLLIWLGHTLRLRHLQP